MRTDRRGNESGRWPILPPPRTFRAWTLVLVGPGLVMAATGVGAGDMVSAAVGGARFGLALLWIIGLGALLKFALGEGIARWQLATDTTLLEGWCVRLHPAVRYLFLVYLVVWAFFVSGGLASMSGLAGHTLFPLGSAEVSVMLWGGIHMVAGGALVHFGRYGVFEKVMATLVGIMFFCTVLGAVLTAPDWVGVLRSAFVPTAIPTGSGPFILSAIGGVGGSVTLLSYGYWLIEARRSGRGWMKATRADLVVCYVTTAVFGFCLMIMAAQVLHPAPDITQKRDLLIRLADALRHRVGEGGYWLFALGFWGGVFSSILGVLSGIPYLFSHLVALIRKVPEEGQAAYLETSSPWYRGFLLFLVFPPLVWLGLEKPVAMAILYTILASLITPFIAATLLYMNNRAAWVGEARNGKTVNGVLVLSLVLFLYLLVKVVVDMTGKIV